MDGPPADTTPHQQGLNVPQWYSLGLWCQNCNVGHLKYLVVDVLYIGWTLCYCYALCVWHWWIIVLTAWNLLLLIGVVMSTDLDIPLLKILAVLNIFMVIWIKTDCFLLRHHVLFLFLLPCIMFLVCWSCYHRRFLPLDGGTLKGILCSLCSVSSGKILCYWVQHNLWSCIRFSTD